MEIAPGYTVDVWNKLELNPANPEHEDWDTAVTILRSRIEQRFIEPVDKLIALQERDKKRTYGFAILAIDFLVLETIQGFKEGVTDHKGQSTKLITNFLKDWKLLTENVPEEKSIEDATDEIYKSYRCALHHSAGTDSSYLIRKSGKIIDFNAGKKCIINRTAFHNGLKKEFDKYLDLLLEKDQKEKRDNFIKKMNYICNGNPPDN